MGERGEIHGRKHGACAVTGRGGEGFEKAQHFEANWSQECSGEGEAGRGRKTEGRAVGIEGTSQISTKGSNAQH